MPIKVPNNLPAVDTLTRENVFVMTDSRAMTQDIRPLQIIILNLMPTKIDTETQLTRLLGNTPLQVELELLQVSTHKVHVTPEEHMIAFYKTFDQVRGKYYDGMIITGAPVELMEFEEVEYWDELCEIMEWSKSHVHSTFHICWGAQAGLYYHYGIRKYVLPKKLSGVYRHTLEYRTGMLFRGFDDEFYVPHSRNTAVSVEDVEACEEIKIISMSNEAGIFAVKSNNDRQIFIMGHSEYDADTLKKEYMRDIAAGKNPEIPCGYFPDDDPEKEPVVKWRSCANLLYSNWLNYFVYQSTPYDLKTIAEAAAGAVLPADVNVIVSKFGGTSLADAGMFRKTRDIIKSDPKRRYVVVSAPGKRIADDRKVTDLLIKAAQVKGSRRYEYLGELEHRYVQLDRELETGIDMDREFTVIRETADVLPHDRVRDYMASRGEYIAAKLMAKLTGFDFIDAADIIRFGDDGLYDADATGPLIRKVLAAHDRAVIPGFYGTRHDGLVETFTRGGSDISGAIVAAAVGADMYENWTDVSGMLMADPAIVENPIPVPLVTYRELREMAYLGAEVMHQDAVFPVIKMNIPISIKNTFEPGEPGTLIVKSARYYESRLDISGISGRPGFVGIAVERAHVNEDAALRASVLKVFSDAGIRITNIMTGVDSLTLLVVKTELQGFEPAMLKKRIEAAVGEAAVTYTGDIAVIGIVGHEISNSPNTAIKVLSALANRRIDIKLIDHSSGKMSMLVAVADKDYEESVQAIYHQFVHM